MPRRPRHLSLRVIERIFRTRTVHDARRIMRAVQLIATFGLLIVMPVVLLAYFAISSIQAGEDSLEADLAPRTSAVIRQVLGEERDLFRRFEDQATRRLTRNQSPVNALEDLSPQLLAAYIVDREGRMQEPFDLPDIEDTAEPTPAFEQAWRRGIRAERAGQDLIAAGHYKVAATLTPSRRLQGQARLAYARMLTRAGQGEGAYADVLGEYGSVRDSNGFRIGDVALLNQAELSAARSPEGAVALKELIDILLANRWTLLEGGEPTVARRALSRLEDLRASGAPVDADWLSRARLRLEQRDAQLFWSGNLYDELLEVVQAPPEAADGFVYRSGPSTTALWSLRSIGGGMVVYAFDRDAIAERLRRTASRLADLDNDLVASVGLADPDLDGPTVFRQYLDHLPMYEVRVAAADPAALAAARRRGVTTRIAIVLLAILTAVIGVGITVRYVTRELEAARMKTDFAANVSHELRSPITQIRLKGEALQLDLVFDDADRQLHYDAIVRESERLSRLVDNVLDFAAIERGAKSYTLRPEDLIALLYGTADTNRAAIEQHGMTIELDVPDDLPVVWIDREAIGQVLTNLLSNAMKYGSDGKWLGISAAVVGAYVEVRVADRGMGIRAEDQARVFEDFFRSSDPAVRRRKGTGIGLTIVRYIVEAHGGTISVESVPGEGAAFVIHLPLQPPAGAGA